MALIINHFNHTTATADDSIHVMMPTRLQNQDRRAFFQDLLLAGRYTPAYAVDTDDLSVAFDTGNGYAPKDVKWIRFPGAQRSTSVGDIIQQGDGKWMLVMPTGFEEI